MLKQCIGLKTRKNNVFRMGGNLYKESRSGHRYQKSKFTFIVLVV